MIEVDQRQAAKFLGCSVGTVSKYSNFPAASSKRIPRNPLTSKYPVLGLVAWSLKNSAMTADLKHCAAALNTLLRPES